MSSFTKVLLAINLITYIFLLSYLNTVYNQFSYRSDTLLPVVAGKSYFLGCMESHKDPKACHTKADEYGGSLRLKLLLMH